jgi:hypothetical protein
MIPSWLSAFFSSISNFIANIFAYIAGKKDAESDQIKKNLEIQKTYEKIDEQNMQYHDEGKSGLLDRVRDSKDSAPK